MGLDKDDIKQLIAILQKGLLEDDEDSDTSDIATNKKNKPRTTKTKKNPKRKNVFESMPEKNMHKDDIEIDRKLRQSPPTSRSRSYKPINVKCRVCGKKDKISPSLVESLDRYKCNKCSTSSG